jgi:hypothetical protein
VFTVSYTVGYVQVFVNGVLLNAADYTASNGTSVTLASACVAGDIVEFVAISVNTFAAGPTGPSGFTTGYQTIWVPAAAMSARTTNGAVAGSTELATNLELLSYFAFDSTTAEYVQFNVQMPKSWDEGVVLLQFVWTHPATTTNFGVNWNAQAYAFSDGDNINAAFGTAQNVDDTGGNTSYCYISANTPAVTIGGTPAASDWVIFQVYRNPAAAGDTMAVDAYLLGVRVLYTADASNDT